jgi:stage V sporulation protein B
MPTAFSHVAEQVVKIAFILLLAGRISGLGVEYACAAATLSAALGEIANLAVLSAVYIYKRRCSSTAVHTGKLTRKRNIFTNLLKISVPVSANRLIVSTLNAVEYIMIPAMLASGGLEYKSSMELFGRLTGMALPLIMFPSLVTNSLATVLVPAISGSVSLKNYKAVNYKISKSIQTTLILGMIFTAMLISYPDKIGSLIYRRENIGNLLFMLSFSCIFIYLHQTLTGVLNGLGKQGVLLRDTMIGSALRIATVYFLIPVYGIQSYILGLTVSYILTSCLNLLAINKITGLLIDLREWLLKPGLIAAVMVLTGRYIYYFFEIFKCGPTLTILMTVSANVLISGFLMMMTGILKLDEILNMAGLKNR